VDDALFGSNPAELTVVDEVAPGFAPILDERFEGVAFDPVCKVGDGCADDFVPTADCEGLLRVSIELSASNK
jgi:hypothetical protein